MAIDRGFLAILEAKPGKGDELGDFLRTGRDLAPDLPAAEPDIRPLDVLAVKGPKPGRPPRLSRSAPKCSRFVVELSGPIFTVPRFHPGLAPRSAQDVVTWCRP